MIIDWLKAQHKVMGDTVESIFILDDIVGFINEEHYMEFAHPYLKRICDAFPKDWVKVYHNDAEVDACLDHLPDAGFNVLNWGKQKDIREVKRRVGDRMCLMGNVNPLEIAVRGTPEEVREATLDVLEGAGGEGIILSVGGGISPGMPRENIVAMLEALEEFNAGRLARKGRGMADYALMNQLLYEGKAKEVEQMTKDALAEGRAVQEILTEGLIAGMSVVGEDFKHNVLYVPEVLIAARAMKAGMAVLKPLLTAKDGSAEPGGRLADGHRPRRPARYRQEPGLHDGRRRRLRGARHRRGPERRKIHGRRRPSASRHHRHERAPDHHHDVHEDGDRRLPGGGPRPNQDGGRRSAHQPDVRRRDRRRWLRRERVGRGGPVPASGGGQERNGHLQDSVLAGSAVANQG